MKKLNQINTFSLNLATTLATLILVIFILWISQSIVIPILFSIILAVLVYPLANRIEQLKINRVLATTLSLAIAMAIISLISYIIVIQAIEIADNASNITSKLKVLYQETILWISSTLNISQTELLDGIIHELKEAISAISSYAVIFFQSFSEVLSISVLIPIFSFFFLYYRNAFKLFLIKAFTLSPKEKVEETLSKMYDALQNYMIGQLTVMFIIAILNTIGLYFLGIKFAWFFGILASLLMILPYIGITIGSIFPAIFALATLDSPYYALGVVIWFLFVQFLEGNFITPYIVGSKIALNPLASMLAIIIGGMLFGFAGFILALPIAAILKVLFDASPRTEAFGYILGDLEEDVEDNIAEIETEEIIIPLEEEQNDDEAEKLEIRS